MGHSAPVSRANGRLKIAMTLEQCWHRVPGGTAVAGIGMARSVAARGVSLPLPRVVLYEAWHRLRRPSVERATGHVEIVHATALAVPPRSAPLLVTIHDLAFLHQQSHFTRRGDSFFRRGLEIARRTRISSCVRPRPRPRTARATGSTRAACESYRWASIVPRRRKTKSRR
jgi:hypothetical protein